MAEQQKQLKPEETDTETAEEKTFGIVTSKQTLFLRQHVGTANDDEQSIEYEMSTNVGNGQPIIRSSKSGRFWTVGWQELVRAAVAAGIDED